VKSDISKRTLITQRLYDFDREIAAAHGVVIGIDEAGRGPLAGPVVAAAVCLDAADFIPGINDSKQLSADRRDELYAEIVTKAAAWATGIVSPGEIDRINILQATFVAMTHAVTGLNTAWNIALVDGNKKVPQINESRQMAVVKGDARSASIAAASILAKVTRDRIMDDYHREYPVYGFDEHKGYGTALHRERILENGLCPIHRVSFCGNLLQTTLRL
jgi:ribonuclease HII